MLQDGDTIAAIATPPGNGGVGVIRISGPRAAEIARRLAGKLPKPRYAVFRHFRDSSGGLIDSGLMLYFPGPASFTGEDVLELQAHGGRIVLDMLLRRVLECGARMAEPGEFSRRAFLNNKIDLVQAEAIADLITSSTEQAVRSAQQSLQGVFSQQVTELVDELIELRVFIEAAIDFVDDEIDFLSDGLVADRIKRLRGRIRIIQLSAQQGRLLHDGISVVLAGRPNAGKSSLLNALAGYDAAIVAELAGTTRDVLRERIQVDGMPLHIIDTAGLRDSDCTIEQEGVRRAQREIRQADVVLQLIDASDDSAVPGDLGLPTGATLIKVFNKIDLIGQAPGMLESECGVEIRLSAKTGQGLELLRAHLKRCAGYSDASENAFVARRRHVAALLGAEQALANAEAQMQAAAPELVAEELRQAQTGLASITGEFGVDDLLGEIFSSFCIGK